MELCYPISVFALPGAEWCVLMLAVCNYWTESRIALAPDIGRRLRIASGGALLVTGIIIVWGRWHGSWVGVGAPYDPTGKIPVVVVGALLVLFAVWFGRALAILSELGFRWGFDVQRKSGNGCVDAPKNRGRGGDGAQRTGAEQSD